MIVNRKSIVDFFWSCLVEFDNAPLSSNKIWNEHLYGKSLMPKVNTREKKAVSSWSVCDGWKRIQREKIV
ncbi:hypothetical protein VNO77_23098 [Canavalia gladiata]|uniref:Uncharacterized protein n=1 Tax=Canavalia gladiata TaxID=3824 RepID=A0AAN9L935_CANGL